MKEEVADVLSSDIVILFIDNQVIIALRADFSKLVYTIITVLTLSHYSTLTLYVNVMYVMTNVCNQGTDLLVHNKVNYYYVM